MASFGLLGYPIDHSLSPQLYRELWEKEGLHQLQYRLFSSSVLLTPQKLLVDTPDLVGFNVTLPFKEAVLPFLEQLTPEALAIGAVNTVSKLPEGGWIGHNTDADGFFESLPKEWQKKAGKVLVLGQGGAARAVVFALQKRGWKGSTAGRRYTEWLDWPCVSWDSLDSLLLTDFDLIVQATPLGNPAFPEQRAPLFWASVRPQTLVFELVYFPAKTPFVVNALEHGARVVYGMSMLENQAKKAWEFWRESLRNGELCESEKSEHAMEEANAIPLDNENAGIDPALDTEITVPTPEEAPIVESVRTEEEPIVESVRAEEEPHAVEEVHDDHTLVTAAAALPDYSSWETEALLVEAKVIATEHSLDEMRFPLEAIKIVLTDRFNHLRQEALDRFVSEGGVAMDFHFEQLDRIRFQDAYTIYKNKKSAWRKQENDRMALHLVQKRALLASIKALAENPELPNHKVYQEFRVIQEQWKAIGPVPSDDAQTLYPTYRFFVDRFYDHLRLSNDLRELDHKHNEEVKEGLIRQAEEMLNSALGTHTTQKLQALHAAWKETGPVDIARKEILWERFKSATDVVHEKRRVAVDEAKAHNAERVEAKKPFVQEVEVFVQSLPENFNAWSKAFEKIDELRKGLQGAGHTFGEESDALWKRFRTAEHLLAKRRNTYYKERKTQFSAALAQKMVLVDAAEALQESHDFLGTAATLKKLQSDWKKTPFVPKADGDKVWDRFRTACNRFFDRMKEVQQAENAATEVHVVAKKALLSEAEECTVGGREDLSKLLDLSKRWKEAGALPASARALEGKFHAAMDKLFGSLDMNKSESDKLRYQHKLESLSTGGTASLEREVQFCRTRLDEAKRSADKIETNLSFFSVSKSSKPNPLLADARKSLDAAKAEVVEWETKLKAARQALSRGV